MREVMSPISKDTHTRIQKHIAVLAGSDQEAAVRAENRLIRFGFKAVEPLLEVLDHSDPMVRLRAGWALGISKDPRAFEAVCRLLHDPDERVRYDAAIVLGHYGDERAVPILWALVRNEADPVLGSAAAMALVKFGIEAFPDE